VGSADAPARPLRPADTSRFLGLERAAREKFEGWLREMEAAAAELVEVGDALFRRGEPADPTLLPRYRLYKRVKAALALPLGPERVAALHAAKIDDRRKH
jgi:hypothetical protein